MNKMILVLTIVCAVSTTGNADDVRYGGLSPQAVQAIRMQSENGPYIYALLPEEKESFVSLPVDKGERLEKDAEFWIKKMIRPQWWPSEFKGKFTAMKDVKLWEKRDERGILISELVGDFLCLEYEKDGRKVYLHESGSTVSARIDFPVPQTITDPDVFMKKMLTEFLNLSDQINVRGNHTPSLYTATTEFSKTEPPKDWKHSIHACTDGSFFFIFAGEVDPDQEMNPRANPGLYDRF